MRALLAACKYSIELAVAVELRQRTLPRPFAVLPTYSMCPVEHVCPLDQILGERISILSISARSGASAESQRKHLRSQPCAPGSSHMKMLGQEGSVEGGQRPFRCCDSFIWSLCSPTDDIQMTNLAAKPDLTTLVSNTQP